MNEQQRRAHSTIIRIAANMVRGSYLDYIELTTEYQKTVSSARLRRLMGPAADRMRTDGADLADALKVLAEAGGP